MADVARRNGVYGGWTHAGSSRVFVRVPTGLKQTYESVNGVSSNGRRPQLETTPIVLVHGFSSSRSTFLVSPISSAAG
jgi:hypothetical protein